MTKPVLRIIGEGKTAGPQAPASVVATIYRAEPTGHGDYSCCVSIPALFEKDRHILGVDEDNAKQVAAFFVQELLRDYQLSFTRIDSEAP